MLAPHPTWGAAWVSSLEDLVPAKLEWSEGSPELQLRDASTLLRMNERAIDHVYLSHWARVLGVEGLLRAVSRGAAPRGAVFEGDADAS